MVCRVIAMRVVLAAAAAACGFAPTLPAEAVPSVEVNLAPWGSAASLDDPYRWRDIATNLYAPSYRDTFTYDDATIVLAFETYQDSTFAGHLSGANLKPNFAYQMKLVGKPESVWGASGDDLTNERIGYAGRWWRAAPMPGNSNDQEYEAHKGDSTYIFEGYLVFGFFATDRFGAAELDFATENSFHVLWWEHQRARGPCDSPVRWSTVVGFAGDQAYDDDVGPVDVGIYAEIERLCFGETALPAGDYNCRFALTEESFHQTGQYDGNWASVAICDTVFFELAGPAGTGRSAQGPGWSLLPGPSPFGTETVIRYDVPGKAEVTLRVYDITGRCLRVLAAGETGAGEHSATWDAEDSLGRKVSPGVYFIRLNAGRSTGTAKVVFAD